MKNNYVRAALRWFRFRGLALLVVFLCGFVALMMGVGVSDRAGVPDSDPMTKLYYTLGLFVLGGMDLGVPQGGPPWARGLLWAAYFGAPLVTASAVAEGILRVIDPQTWRLRRLHGHVVVAGAGDLALLYLEGLRRVDTSVEVVVVEKELDATHIDLIQNRFRARVVRGDIASAAIMESVNVSKARRVLLLTGSDFANLEAATLLASKGHEVVAHVGDINMRRVLERNDALSMKLFNSHQIAAQKLVAKSLVKHFKETEKLDQVVLAGFGRFGQTVLHELLAHCPKDFDKVVVLDIKAHEWLRLFRDHHGDMKAECAAISGDMTDPATWDRVYDEIDFEQSNPVVILGSDKDELNIRAALWLRAHPDANNTQSAKLFVRCFQNTELAETLGKECNFEVVSVAELIKESMGQWT